MSSDNRISIIQLISVMFMSLSMIIMYGLYFIQTILVLRKTYAQNLEHNISQLFAKMLSEIKF